MLKRSWQDDPRGHVWIEEDGIVNTFAYEHGEFHNGPRCAVCGFGYCHHCNKKEVPRACPGPRKEWLSPVISDEL